jgi:hypothetical protein
MTSEYIYIISGLIILIILFGLFYYYYWQPNKSNISLYKIPLLVDETIFDETYEKNIILESIVTTRDTLYIPKLGYGISFVWDMYIPTINGNDKWHTNYNRLKPIISMSDSPVISYHPKKNYLSIVLKYRNNPFYAQFAEIKFENIKPQRWSKYIMIIDNNIIKLYIDTILVATKTLPSIPVIYDIKSEIILGDTNNNFQGKVRNMSFYPFPLDYNDIVLV